MPEDVTHATAPGDRDERHDRGGVDVADRIVSPDIGLLLVVGGTTFIDTGDHIHIDGPLHGEVLRALHILARRKGCRELSLMDPWGMPQPVPQGSVTVAVQEILNDLGNRDDARHDMLVRITQWGNPHLERLVACLVTLADANPSDEIRTEVVQYIIDMAMGDEGSLWRHYRLEEDIKTMCVPGNALSRPFNPHPKFHEIYLAPASEGEHDTTGLGEGASQ